MWSPSSTWEGTRTALPPKRPTSPKTTQRLIQLMSGIFDNSGAGEAIFPVSPVQPLAKKENDELSTLQAADLFALLEGSTNLPLVENEVPVSPPGEDLLIGEGGSQFLEGFTNLSDYLFDGAQTPVEMTPSTVVPLPLVAEPMMMEAESSSSSSVVATSRKRTASDAFIAVPSTSANTDHDDYVAKKPRRAAATPKRAGKAETPQKEKESRYRERRDKNNIASRRSREIRKQKFSAMELKAHELEEANLALERKVVELERLTKSMKAILVERLSKTM